MTSYCPIVGVGPERPPTATLGWLRRGLTLNDVKLAMARRARCRCWRADGGTAESLYHALAEGGDGGLDFSALMKLLDGGNR